MAVKRPLWLLDEPTSALDREAQDTLAELMQRHLSGGGLIVAAAHGPIGLDHARELRLGGAGMSPLAALFMRDMRLAIRVGGGGGIGVLFFLIVVVLMPFAIGPDLALLATHWAGDSVAWGVARVAC